MNMKAIVAEFIGTFALIFIGAGSGAIGAGGLLGVAFAHGFVVIGFAYAYGHLSGVHLNPAVTIGLWVGGVIEWRTAVYYTITQLLGGIAGALALLFVLGSADSGLGVTILSPDTSPLQGLFLETLLTFFLVNAIYNAAVSGKAGNFSPLAIGFTLIFCILMGAPLTGASLNPARTLGPALASGNFADIWLYFVGPVAGGILAGLLYRGFLKSTA